MPRILWRAFRIQTRGFVQVKRITRQKFFIREFDYGTHSCWVLGKIFRRMQHDAAVIGWKTIYGNNIETRRWTTWDPSATPTCLMFRFLPICANQNHSFQDFPHESIFTGQRQVKGRFILGVAMPVAFRVMQRRLSNGDVEIHPWEQN